MERGAWRTDREGEALKLGFPATATLVHEAPTKTERGKRRVRRRKSGKKSVNRQCWVDSPKDSLDEKNTYVSTACRPDGGRTSQKNTMTRDSWSQLYPKGFPSQNIVCTLEDVYFTSNLNVLYTWGTPDVDILRRILQIIFRGRWTLLGWI